MSPKWHFLIGIIASAALAIFSNFSFFQISLFFLSSIVIDVDHYIWFALKTKDYNFFNAVKWCSKNRDIAHSLSKQKRNEYGWGVFIFHSLFLVIILLLLSKIYPIFFFIALGTILHLITDYIAIIHFRESWYYKISPFATYLTNKNKKSLFKLLDPNVHSSSQ